MCFVRVKTEVRTQMDVVISISVVLLAVSKVEEPHSTIIDRSAS